MPLIQITNVESENLSLDESKIERHEVPIKGLELQLGESLHHFHVYIDLEGYGNTRFKNLGKDRKNALKQYQDIVEKFKGGQYKLHLYDNGKIEVELLD